MDSCNFLIYGFQFLKQRNYAASCIANYACGHLFEQRSNWNPVYMHIGAVL